LNEKVDEEKPRAACSGVTNARRMWYLGCVRVCAWVCVAEGGGGAVERR
jgi:hypothetical protein